jgi:O-antigen ligase
VEKRSASYGALTIAAAFLVIFFIAAPALVPCSALTFVAVVLAHARREARVGAFVSAVLAPSRTFAALTIVGVYLLVNASWSSVPAFAYRVTGFYFVLVFLVLLAFRATQEARPEIVRANALGLCVGLAVGLLFLLSETLTDMAALRLLMSYMPSLLERRSQVEDGWVLSVPDYYSNRSMLAASICLWPLLLTANALNLDRWKRVLFYLAMGAGGLAIAASEHETSKLACLGGALIFFVGCGSLRAARWLVTVSWVAATALVVPLCVFLYAQGLHSVTWLPYSARDRVVIWGYTAEQVAQAPLLGVGIGSARTLRAVDAAGDEPATAPGTVFKKSTSYHSHNAFLQVWFETGAVGAGLLFGLGLLVIWSIQSAPAAAQPYLHSAFVTCALLASTGFSLWAPWIMASLAFAPMLASVGIQLIKERQGADAGSAQVGAVSKPANGGKQE